MTEEDAMRYNEEAAKRKRRAKPSGTLDLLALKLLDTWLHLSLFYDHLMEKYLRANPTMEK